jgi:hypothetical protein
VAVNEAGQNLDAELAERLLQLDAKTPPDPLRPSQLPETSLEARLDADMVRLADVTRVRSADAGNERLKRAQARIDAWADDMIQAAEAEVEKVRVQLRAARRGVDDAPTVAEQADASKKVIQLEKARRRVRNDLEDAEDEVAAQRRRMLADLAERCRRTEDRENLLLIRWSVV